MTEKPQHVQEPEQPGGSQSTSLDEDEGGRRLAGSVLEAASRGDRSAIGELTAPLDVDQLRSLVTALAVQVDKTMPSGTASGPAAVCELAINAAAPLFGVTPEAILSSQRSRPVSDARAVAMTAARHSGLSLPSIGEHFGTHHASVIHAVRRTQEQPRLTDAAARVAKHVATRYSERLPQPGQATPGTPGGTPGGTLTAAGQESQPGFEPHGLVEHAVAAAAEAFDTSPETLLGTDRTRAVSDARAVAMTAARMRGQSLPQIARHFDRDHTTVLHATRRIEKTPPLRELAAKIAGELPEDAAAHNGSSATPSETVTTRPGSGVRDEHRGGIAPPADRHLTVAR